MALLPTRVTPTAARRSEVGASLANDGSVEEGLDEACPFCPDYGAGGACDPGEAELHADKGVTDGG
jgi:hypothetical protein